MNVMAHHGYHMHIFNKSPCFVSQHLLCFTSVYPARFRINLIVVTFQNQYSHLASHLQNFCSRNCNPFVMFCLLLNHVSAVPRGDPYDKRRESRQNTSLDWQVKQVRKATLCSDRKDVLKPERVFDVFKSRERAETVGKREKRPRSWFCQIRSVNVFLAQVARQFTAVKFRR